MLVEGCGHVRVGIVKRVAVDIERGWAFVIAVLLNGAIRAGEAAIGFGHGFIGIHHEDDVFGLHDVRLDVGVEVFNFLPSPASRLAEG